MGQDMDLATKNLLQSMANEEFSLRRSSVSLQSSAQDRAIDGLLTPEHSPEKSSRCSPSTKSFEQQAISGTTEAVSGPQTLSTSDAAITSANPVTPDVLDTPPSGLRRSKRNASTRATSAMQAITAATLHPADWVEGEQNVEQEPPSKKAKVTLHVQPRASETSPHVHNGNSRDAGNQLGTSFSTPVSQQALGSMLGNTSTGSQVASASVNLTGPSTGSPRKRAAPSKAKVQAFVEEIKPTDARPEPHGQPLVWAEERQALCETLPYYRAYQSGAYTTEGLAFGFLLDKDCGERAYMDEEIVITRA